MKNGKFFVRIASNGRPVMGSLMERKNAPRDGGRWADITECLGLCCTYVAPTESSPINFAAEDGIATVNEISWGAVTGADTYKLERSTSVDFSTALTTLQNTSGTSYSDTGRTSGTAYYYRVSVIANGVQGNYAYASNVAP